MRADVQARFRAVAAEMLAVEHTYCACVSKVLVEAQAGEWSEPVRVRFEPHDDGTIEIVVKRVEDE
jgi:hypothetical protein